MNNIILIDDDKDFTTSFVNEAAALTIGVSPQSSLEGLKRILPAFAHKYAAVVLDIKCLLTDSQTKESADFIGAALHYIDTNVPGFPRFILTGDETEFEGLKKYYPKEKMFLKKPDDQKELFIELQSCIKDAEPLRLKRENPAVFEAFDQNKLDVAKETILVSVLINYNESNPAKFKGILADVRELHEEVYRAINKRNKAVVRDSDIKANNSPSFTGSFHKHLEGNPNPADFYKPTTPPYQDSTIAGATKLIHHACSEYVHGTSKTGYQITPYAIKALVNSLLEVIIWSKQY
ncbi:hypothetical protein [Pedobacter sp. Leaf194]|uniref:hypothetical protein n=1 Tax=Pedobacter sp. Leaf194 TaxID=1736297 RepID=UPI0007037B19|nr:hypothetical protein [Pedobacter sp. Leaf194]KQS41828.1 hypothetical protein ASG14_05115 [Pedobacter sp. Leaf194]